MPLADAENVTKMYYLKKEGVLAQKRYRKRPEMVVSA
jgi:hypothetical protein